MNDVVRLLQAFVSPRSFFRDRRTISTSWTLGMCDKGHGYLISASPT